MRSSPSRYNADVLVVTAEGRLDALAAPDFEQTLAQLEAQGRVQIILDLGRATYLSSSCLRVMLIHLRNVRCAGGDIKLCCPSNKVARVLDITGFDAILRVLPTEELAARAFCVAEDAVIAQSPTGQGQLDKRCHDTSPLAHTPDRPL